MTQLRKSNQWVVKDGSKHYGPFPNLMSACDWLDTPFAAKVRGPVEYIELIRGKAAILPWPGTGSI